MNTGQVMFILGAFAMLSMLTLSMNTTMYGSVALSFEMEATLNAVSVGQSMMDEIMQKNFDQQTLNSVVYSTSGLTQPASLGAESGETISGADSAYTVNGVFHDFSSMSKFNDVDDYHLYHRRVYDARMGYFDVVDSVYYVVEATPDVNSGVATFYKKVVVTVSHPNLPKKHDTDSTSAPVVLRDFKVYRQYF